MTNLEQARVLYEKCASAGWKKPAHRCRSKHGARCVQPLFLGIINPPTFTGEDLIWGTNACGSLMAEWDYRKRRIDRIYGVFPSALSFSIIEDYTKDLL